MGSGNPPALAPERMSVIMKPDDLRGAVLLAKACIAEGDNSSCDCSGVGEGEGVEGFTVCLSKSSSDMSGLELITGCGYSEYSRFLGGTADNILAVSTVIVYNTTQDITVLSLGRFADD